MNLDKRRHLSLDLETLGKRYGSVIASIGMCSVVSDGQFFFERYLSVQAASMLGFVTDQETAEWWNGQPEELRKEQLGGNYNPVLVLADIYNLMHNAAIFAECQPDELYIWCQGTDFDIPILGAYFDRFYVIRPWKYNMVRDIRTCRDLFPEIHVERQEKDVKHSALGDARRQAELVSNLIDMLSFKEKEKESVKH